MTCAISRSGCGLPRHRRSGPDKRCYGKGETLLEMNGKLNDWNLAMISLTLPYGSAPTLRLGLVS